MHESRDDQCLMVNGRVNEIMHLREFEGMRLKWSSEKSTRAQRGVLEND